MPSSHTTNYQLSQWERTDQVQMEDFNADNAKIDAAIKAEADARTAADAAINQVLSKKGNCRIKLSSYVGNGTYTQEGYKYISFDSRPLVCIIGCDTALAVLFYGANKATVLSKLDGSANVYFRDMPLTWSSNQVGLMQYSAQAQLNEQGKTYYVLAFYPMD